MEQQWSVPAKVLKQDLDNHLRGLCTACQASTIAKTKTTCYQSCKDTRTRRFSNSKFLLAPSKTQSFPYFVTERVERLPHKNDQDQNNAS